VAVAAYAVIGLVAGVVLKMHPLWAALWPVSLSVIVFFMVWPKGTD
jgi:hypothetical protein